MTRLHRRVLVAALLFAPLLLTLTELARLRVDGFYVESDVDDVADSHGHIVAVAAHLPAWHVAGFGELAFTVTWALAVLAMTILLAERRPALALAGGLLGLLSVVGSALHLAFYYLPLADLARAADVDLAARAGALLGGGDPLSFTALLLFLFGTILTPLVLGIGLWLAHEIPWWAAAAAVAWVLTAALGLEATPAALLNLLLLPLTVAVARRLGGHVPERRAAVTVATAG